MEAVREEDVLVLKDFTTTKENLFMIIPTGQTKEHTTFMVYNFLIENFDKAYLGYPVIFIFGSLGTSKANSFMTAGEVGARVADSMEALNLKAIISIEKNGEIIEVHFLSENDAAFDTTLIDMPTIGTC